MARLLIRMTHAPYGDSFAAEGLEFAFAATNYGHEAVLLFEGEGVLQLKTGQHPLPGEKNQFKRLTAAPLFDIEEIYVCALSLQTWDMNREELQLDCQSVDTAALLQLLRTADHVVTF